MFEVGVVMIFIVIMLVIGVVMWSFLVFKF